MSTGVVESTVNQVISTRFCTKQQMAWTARGAHLRLPIRTRVLNGDWEATFREGIRGSVSLPNRWRRGPPMIKRSPMADRCVQQRRQDLILGVRT